MFLAKQPLCSVTGTVLIVVGIRHHRYSHTKDPALRFIHILCGVWAKVITLGRDNREEKEV